VYKRWLKGHMPVLNQASRAPVLLLRVASPSSLNNTPNTPNLTPITTPPPNHHQSPQVLIAFLQLPHDHMSLYADYSPYLCDPPEHFVEILRDMEKDDPE
jgi:hypothetical protein